MYNKGRKRRGVNNRATNNNSSSNNMATKGNLPKKERVLMRAWLVKRVEEGQIPGLVWEDAAHTMIRIPWVHGSRHAWAIEKHSKLFQAWAEHSGKCMCITSLISEVIISLRVTMNLNKFNCKKLYPLINWGNFYLFIWVWFFVCFVFII